MSERTQEALTDEDRELLLTFAAGDEIFREGVLGGEMFVIQRGEVEILHQGNRLALLKPGDFFGEMALLEGLPRSATARAVTECGLLPVDAEAFDYMIRNVSELAIRMMRKLSGRLRGRLQAPGPKVAATAAGTEESGGAFAKLLHEPTGREFALQLGEEISLGRPDSVTGIVPEIDVSFVPEGLSVSRKHARLVPHADGFSLVEEIGVANGTTVNGEPIRAGRPVPLSDGDRVTLGEVGFRYREG